MRENHISIIISESVKPQLMLKFASKMTGAEGKNARCAVMLIPHGVNKSGWIFVSSIPCLRLCGSAFVNSARTNKTILQRESWSLQ